MSKLTELKKQQRDLLKRARDIWDVQFEEERELTAEEREQYKQFMDKLETLSEKIKEERRLAEFEAALEEANGADETYEFSTKTGQKETKKAEAPKKGEVEPEEETEVETQRNVTENKEPGQTNDEQTSHSEEKEEANEAEKEKGENQIGEKNEGTKTADKDRKGIEASLAELTEKDPPEAFSEENAAEVPKTSEKDEKDTERDTEKTSPKAGEKRDNQKEKKPPKKPPQKKQKAAARTQQNPDWVLGVNEVKQNGQTTNAEIDAETEAKHHSENDDSFDPKSTQGNGRNGRGNVSLLSRLNKQREASEVTFSENKTSSGEQLGKKGAKAKSLRQNKEQESGGKESREDPYRDLKNKLHRALIDEIDKDVLQKSNTGEKNEELEQEVTETMTQLLDEQDQKLSPKDRETIMEELLNETLGYGPITPLIEDDQITEIMVNGPNQVYVEKDGKLKETNINFRDAHHVFHVIEKIVAPLGRRIDESSPLVDARLPDGSRVNAIIPPLSLVGPVVTIRKFSRDPLEAKDLVSFGTMSTEMMDFLKTCVEKRLNIVVSGGTGSGKTTTLNVLSSFIPDDERIVTIEDAAELTLHQDHVVTLETRPPNMEGKGAITMRELVANSLRMRPDRIVVGEVRGGEALDMLQAMNTGHDGSLTTGHANSPRDMLSRLETMVLMAGMDLPIRAIREQIASAVDLIVHQDRMEDGSRKVVKVTDVQGMEGDVITMQDLFVFNREGRDAQNRVKGKFESTGFSKTFLKELNKK